MSGYADRRHAGRVLGETLAPRYAGRADVIVLALPRGGVPVAFEVAARLRAPLDVFMVRKLGVPGHEELAVGAVASGGVRVLNESVVKGFRISKAVIDSVAKVEERELARRERAYRAGRAPLDVTGRVAVLIDDGLATGSTMRAAVTGLRQRKPGRVVVAVPIAAPSTCDELAPEVDDIVCAATSEPLVAVGRWYEDFSQTSDEEVGDLLERARRPDGSSEVQDHGSPG
jgi:putative phosphoribosyl transferase